MNDVSKKHEIKKFTSDSESRKTDFTSSQLKLIDQGIIIEKDWVIVERLDQAKVGETERV